jgi:alpha-D-glucose phosphate-specific phosphoglucomutase
MIKFGTSGWRGIIADDFTYDNVRLVTQAIADYVNEHEKAKAPAMRSVVIGYDTRFMSDRFARASAEVLAGNRIKVLICKRDTPTPVIAYEIIRQKLSGGINFTASHNPFQYNGLKFSPDWGGPALPETTKSIEERCARLKQEEVKLSNYDDAMKLGLIEELDPRPAYFKRIKELVNFAAIKKGNLKVITNLLYGTGIGYLDDLLEKAGVKQEIVNNHHDVLFGKSGSPEPNEENMNPLIEVIKKRSCDLALATDGDADRFGVLDSDGSFINPNEVISVLLYHLVKTRGWKGVVARSVMTTHLIDRLCLKFGLELKETPVGFKYIGEIMMKEGGNFIIGGEESGGLTIRGHVPEKDGVLACLLMAEMVAMHKKPVRKILKDIEKLVGPVHSKRLNFHLTFEEIESFRSRLKEKLPSEIDGLKVKETITLDGYKFVLEDGSWIGTRFSGTEPVVRLYVEADSVSKLNKLINSGKSFIKG